MAPGPVQDTLARIETPENVWLSFRLAGPGSRMGAYLLDLLIRVGIMFGLSALTTMFLMPVLGTSIPFGVLLLGYFLLEWGYGALFEGLWNGRTPGKRLTGLRVIKVGGYPISFLDALLRNFLRAADILPIFYGVGLLTMFSNRRMQRIGDLLAGTMVVREGQERLREGLPYLHRVQAIPRSQLRSGRRPSERTLDLIETLFLRRRELLISRLDEIAAVLAHPLAERLGYDSPKSEHLRAPARFLLSVYKTFHQAPGAGDNSEEEPARTTAEESTERPVLSRREAP